MKKIIFSLLAVFLVLSPVAFVHAQFDNSLNSLDKAVGPGTKTNLNGDIAGTISTVVSGVLGILGTVFFVLTVYAGIKWMIARGDEGEVEKAKEIIKAAVIGLVVTLAAYALTYFIGTRLTQAASSTSASTPSSGNEAAGCCFASDHTNCASSDGPESACTAQGKSWATLCPSDCH